MSLQHKGQKTGGPGSGVEVMKQGEKCKETAVFEVHVLHVPSSTLWTPVESL